MCLQTVHLVSPKLKAGTYIAGADRYSLDVPCGHCPECNNKKVNDLVFRCYHEYLDCELHHGFTLFQTLTYSMFNTPFSGGFRFFQKSDLQKFLKRVRKRLDSLGYDIDNNLKYIITCEYGSSEKHMHLPHYHVAFFSKVYGLDPSTLDRVIHDSWSHLGDNYTESCELGFVDRRDTGLRVVNSIYGIRYICKYVYKGTSVKDALDYNFSSDISKFIKSYCYKYASRFGQDADKWRYDVLQDWQISHIWRAYVAYNPQIEGFQLMPFYLQSKGLGMSFLENCSLDELFDVVKLPTKTQIGFANFAIPQYYIRKAFYSYDSKTKRFILNEIGKEFKNRISSDMVDNYNDMFRLNSTLLDTISNRIYNVDYQTLIKTALNGRSHEDFIYYAVYLRDRQVPQYLHFLLDNGDLYKNIDVKDYALDFNDNALSQMVMDSPNYAVERFANKYLDTYLLENIPKPKQVVQISLPLHNNLPRFDGFDDLYDKLQKIKYEFTLARNLVLDEKYKSEKNMSMVRSIMVPQNSIIY